MGRPGRNASTRKLGPASYLMMLALLGPAPAGCGDDENNQARFTLGVASGDVTDTVAFTWTRVDRATDVEAELASDRSFDTVLRTRTLAATPANDFTVQTRFEDLSADTRYYYRYRAGERTSEIGTFRTAPAPSQSAAVRFGWVSDTDGSFSPPINGFEALDALRADDPHFWFYLGDTVYMDTTPPIATDLPGMRAKYRETRGYVALRNLMAAGPTWALWDDHEVSNDYARDEVDDDLFAAGREAFQEYMPIGPWQDGSGFYRTFRWGALAEFFLLDERSFRTEKADAACRSDLAPTLPPESRSEFGLPAEPPSGCLETIEAPGRSILGERQKTLFREALQNSAAVWKIVINEVALSQLYIQPYDRWEAWAVERAELLELFASVNNVVVLTGDLHANGVLALHAPSAGTMPAGPPVATEFIAGPIAAPTLQAELINLLGTEITDMLVDRIGEVISPVCLDIDRYAYGLVEIQETGELTATIKDDTGVEVCRQSLTPE